MCILSPLPIVVVGMIFVAMEVWAFPVERIHRQLNFDPLENQNVDMPMNSMLVEGDVKITFVDMQRDMPNNDDGGTRGYGPVKPPKTPRQNPEVSSNPLWIGGVVPYVLDPLLNETEVQTILKAMSFMMKVTSECIKFIPMSSSDLDFVFITSSTTGCYSEVGRQGRGNQTVSVSRASDCVTHGIVMHELLHVLGFWHEHTRPDRDQYIEILHHNIRFDHKTDFAINQNSQNVLTVYDFYSILHYKTNQFSIGDNLKTIRIRDATVDERKVGQRFNLSYFDVLRIKRLYGCGELTRTQMKPKAEMLKRDVAHTEMAPNPRTSALGSLGNMVEETQSTMYEGDISTTFPAQMGLRKTIRHADIVETEMLHTVF
ncbi:zinc metalloproteinase nas-14-like [Dreissena polymorpha]|uniref:Metalloendopeptidase n=1 Tax=Dreissena polymorpha TaxID=45954 RepID=A0A9D4M8T8_DREPO|nr:zinc metalloproteinase nas-14-like [Dreissena polymorpha]KAH3871329.1 hypothetical protein DPMN_034526 [Dreissena polymorpha]